MTCQRSRTTTSTIDVRVAAHEAPRRRAWRSSRPLCLEDALSRRIGAGLNRLGASRRMKDKREHPFVRRYPELRLYPDPDDVHEAITRARHQTSKSVTFWFRNVILVVSLFGAWLVVEILNKRYAALPDWTMHAFNPTILFLAGGGAFWGFRSRMRRCLREDLVLRGIPVCVPCGYDLRGQGEPRCPECGTPFDPALLSRKQQHLN